MRSTHRREVLVSVFMLLSMCAFSTLHASEYYVRPTFIAAFQTWQPTLEFLLVNSGSTPIVVKALAIETASGKQGCALAANTELIMVPPRRATIAVFKCQSPIQKNIRENYTLKVEQVPILFVTPGASPSDDTMLLRNFTVSVIVRRSNTADIQVATIDHPANKTGRLNLKSPSRNNSPSGSSRLTPR